MKHFLILFLALTLVSTPLMAQEGAGTPVPETSSLPAEEVSQERLQLAEQMHKIWPIRTRIEAALDAVAENFPEDRRAQIKASMRQSIKFEQVEEESILAMASTFDEAELQAMIEFYGSDIGRSISAKTASYEALLTPAMVKMLDGAMLELRTGVQ